jgi:hypothetical protein
MAQIALVVAVVPAVLLGVLQVQIPFPVAQAVLTAGAAEAQTLIHPLTSIVWGARVALALCVSYIPARPDHFLQLARVICNGLIYSH